MMRWYAERGRVGLRRSPTLVHLLCEKRKEQHKHSEDKSDPESPRCTGDKLSKGRGQAVRQDVHMPPKLSGTVTTRMLLSALPEASKLDAVLNRRVVGGKS